MGVSSRMRYTFEYRIVGADEWQPKVDAWKTRTGACRNAIPWREGMAEQGCAVETRVGHIEIVPNANGKGTHGVFVPEGAGQ